MKKNWYKVWIRRGVLAAAAIALYFIIWRPVRYQLSDYLVDTIVASTVEQNDVNRLTWSISRQPFVQPVIEWEYREHSYRYVYRPFAGYLLLAGIVGIIALTGRIYPALLLYGVHIFFWSINILGLWMGSTGNIFFLFICYLNHSYLLPFITFITIIGSWILYNGWFNFGHAQLGPEGNQNDV